MSDEGQVATLFEDVKTLLGGLDALINNAAHRKVIAARAETTGVSYEDIEHEYINKVSLRRMVTAKDIANQAMYLCSPLGASISGQAISICGNVEVL